MEFACPSRPGGGGWSFPPGRDGKTLHKYREKGMKQAIRDVRYRWHSEKIKAPSGIRLHRHIEGQAWVALRRAGRSPAEHEWRGGPRGRNASDFLNNIGLVAFFDKRDDGHGTATLRAFQRVDLVHAFDERRPSHAA